MALNENTSPRAIALEYDARRIQAPMVTASGTGWLAEEIVRLARASGVPVREDRDLAQLLGQLDVGQMIPTELYMAVAEILAFLYRANEGVPTRGEGRGPASSSGPRSVQAAADRSPVALAAPAAAGMAHP